MSTPLLRAPPFPGIDASVTRPGAGTDLTSDAIDRIFSAIREARVGGCFWATPDTGAGATVILRARTAGEIEQALSVLTEKELNAGTPIVHDGATTSRQVDPWSVLDAALTLVAHGDDEWIALAVIAGARVHFLSGGRFGAPGDDVARLRQIVAEDLMRVSYRDPFTGQDVHIEETIALLADWRRTLRANQQIVAGCGFSWWKRREIARFLWTPEHPLRFFRSARRALAHAERHGGAVAIWPSRVPDGMAASAAARNVSLVRVEDGFVRSVGLGSNLVPPSSVAVDRRGIHYDPARPSDLELLLADADFPPALLARAGQLRETIIDAGISKYGSGITHAFPPRQAGRRLVLVPGQVEDDMSVRLGGGGLSSNLELLRRARALEPDAEIWFRPHPDVNAGHRKGAVREADALEYADRIVNGGGMASLLDQVDAVHVLTSLTGFEALLRGREVTCHGMPFYAGWGLTRDLAPVPDRRGRRLTLEALIAAVLIVYPRYLDPVTGLPCPPELLIRRMGEGAAHNRLGWVTRLRQVQGRLLRRRT
ncbi:beta-3-deoxy-D-manno-oct-2-ulosonic acid transferase [Sphingomonas sp. QA11]|uniref:capsular polysaccharide export protein, LipB/KpsS family n=1 Tax=Sphingomonas sp. QA11 TaxID=2950605 RepID=UPI00234A167B|nr:beta-3-deoxy-D-manno-oct-2-ulosonic acid transferase [Sphingomonas sp. QA11]WCM29902.1 beta-3-deoxy-D-manno-oct-2-ulosonic acid transferase [Sphingomonas sp. QA11]